MRPGFASAIARQGFNHASACAPRWTPAAIARPRGSLPAAAHARIMVLYRYERCDPQPARRDLYRQGNERILANLSAVPARKSGPLWSARRWCPGHGHRGQRGGHRRLSRRAPPAPSALGTVRLQQPRREKYRRMGLAWPFDRTELLQRAFMEEMAEAARQSGGGCVRRSLERRRPFSKNWKDTPFLWLFAL